MTATHLKFKTAPGHQILAASGKKILRPGGRKATEQLFQFAQFKPGETVLELAASFGESAIAMAKRFDVRVVGIEKNPESVAIARENIRAAGLESQVTIIEGDIFRLDAISEKFDYVLAEAILTMQSQEAKLKVLQGIRDRLKPKGKFLSHELLARDNEEDIHQTLSQAIRVNATPLSQAGWRKVCEAAGLQVQQDSTGKMGLLNPVQMLKDEGLFGTLRIFWNVLTKAQIRERVRQMRRAFKKHEADLGYIVFWATFSVISDQ
ncbi:MAG: class I SAM-dependent methyltransferase [Hydrococcus sp. Prado102]|jgi:SAM-dependent methyltransferase|nr:class I SAM-dependent methyltransferase [Hydrococcus sp. Prado102]